MTDWTPPPGSQLTIEEARRLLRSDLGDAYRKVIKDCCAPLAWHRPESGRPGPILHNGTISFLRTPLRLLGVTAAHVVRQYISDHEQSPVMLQAGNAVLRSPNILCVSPDVDLATLGISDAELAQVGKEIAPLSVWPPMIPQENCGILLGGFPAQDRIQTGRGEANWGLFTALGIARRVIHPQITWRVDREWAEGDLPPNAELGGASGGPMIGLFERRSGIHHCALSGIISEASAQLENVVAIRADLINPDGTIRKP